jgi:hypothetical protein
VATPGATCAAAVKLRASGRVCSVCDVIVAPLCADVTSTTGAAAVTVMDAWTAALRRTSSVTVLLRATWTFGCLTVLNPDSVAVTLYVPAGSSVKRKWPLVSVVSLRTPCRLGDRTSTVTPGRAAPVLSLTVPSIAPVVADCA